MARTLLVAALAAAGLALSIDLAAQDKHRGSGARDWSGHRGGGDRHWGGSRWNGHRHWGGHSHWNWGFYFGAPLVLGAWGWPYYYDDFYYPRETIVYREVLREPEVFPEGRIEPAPTTDVPRLEGAPTQGPLYMNYCGSAKAYFPKVTACPEGWKLATPTR